jgi:hypothetical protein
MLQFSLFSFPLRACWVAADTGKSSEEAAQAQSALVND